MSDRPIDDQPRDWRRRRRGFAAQPGSGGAGGTDPPSQDSMPDDGGREEDAYLSRTIFSFIEPTLDSIGSYSAPMVIA